MYVVFAFIAPGTLYLFGMIVIINHKMLFVFKQASVINRDAIYM
jgi:hypothetical protein